MNKINIHYFIENLKDIPKLPPFASCHGAMINPQSLEQVKSRANNHGPKIVRATEVRFMQ